MFIFLSIIGWRQRCCLVLGRAVLKNVYAICISLTSNFNYIYGQYCHSFCHSYNLHSSLESSKNQENNISSYWAAYVLPSTMKPSVLHAIHLMFATSLRDIDYLNVLKLKVQRFCLEYNQFHVCISPYHAAKWETWKKQSRQLHHDSTMKWYAY